MVVVSGDATDMEARCVHEMMHALCRAEFSHLPIWVDEGAAAIAEQAWASPSRSRVSIAIRRLAESDALPRFSSLLEAQSSAQVVALIQKHLAEHAVNDAALRQLFDSVALEAASRELMDELCAAMVMFVHTGLSDRVDPERLAKVGVIPADARVEVDRAFCEFAASTATDAVVPRLVYGDVR